MQNYIQTDPLLTKLRLNQLRWGIALSFAIWTIVGLLSVSQLYSVLLIEGEQVLLSQALLWQMPGWYLWSILTLLIQRLGQKFPLNLQPLSYNLIIHLFTSLVIAFVHLTLVALLRYPIHFGNRPQTSFPTLWFFTFTSTFHFEILIYWSILGVGHALNYYHKYREQELTASQLEKQLAQAQLQALRMQIHPHFLFNTLHAIAVLVRKQDNQTAIGMITGLSELLRYCLDQQEVLEIPLRQELNFITQYLEIEQMRFQDRLRVEIKVEQETLEAQIPNLILQPIVENALVHGIAARAASGCIEIRAWHRAGQLWLQVRDDGPGLKTSSIPEGVGLANTRARLKQLYGSKQKFELCNTDDVRTVATISLPFHCQSVRATT